MPPRSTPTARQERLGAELRKLREAAGKTSREAAGLLGVDQTKMSHIEAGRVGVSEERVRRLAAHYACDNTALVDALVCMAAERVHGWWEEYRGVLPNAALDLAELEWRATALRTLQVVHIPGLLQTEEYIRAVHTYLAPEPPAEYLEAIVSHRLQRCEILAREAPPTFNAIIHEAALRIRVGSRNVARQQLEFILESAERPGVTVRIVPFERDGFAGSGFSMLYATGPVPQLDTVQFDTAHGGMFLDAEAQLNSYRALFRKVEAAALPSNKTPKFIRRIIQEL